MVTKNKSSQTIHERMQRALAKAEEAASLADDASGYAQDAVDALNDVMDDIPASAVAAKEADASGVFTLPLKSIGENVEDGNGNVVVTCVSSGQADFIASVANASWDGSGQ